MESIDSTAREDIGKLWGAFRELAIDYWGPNRDNGRRSEVLDMLTDLQDLRERLRHYLDVERTLTCVGLQEFKKRDAFKAEIQEEVTEVKVAEINAKSNRDVGKWKAWTDLVAQILTVGGVIFVAVMQVVSN